MRVRWILPVFAPALVVTTAISWWLRFDFVPPDAMGHHVRQAVQHPDVRDELSRRMARAVAREDPRAAAAEPLVRTAAEIVIESRQFGDVLDVAVQVTRRAVVDGRQGDANSLADLELS